MYFLDLDILIKQLLPPWWRIIRKQTPTGIIETDSGETYFLKSVVAPFKLILQDFYQFQNLTKQNINLSGQTMVIEHHIEQLTGIRYGIFILDEPQVNHFSVNVPVSGQSKEKQINQFLQKIVPIGRRYQLKFY